MPLDLQRQGLLRLDFPLRTELQAAARTVRGSFEFVSLEGDERFEAEVPPFALVAPPSEANM